MPADEAYVLSPTDVRNIRSYVQLKYAAMPHDRRAEIVADAVNRIIHRQLPDFENGLKRSVTATLIRTTVLELQRPVRADDIFRVCLSLDRTASTIYDPFHSWVERQLRVSCEKPVLERLLDKLPSGEEMAEKAADEESGSLWAQLRCLLKDEGVAVLEEPAGSFPAEVITLPLPQSQPSQRKIKPITYMYGALCICLIAASLLYGWSLGKPSPYVLQPPVVLKPVPPIEAPADGLPIELRYQEVDQARLIAFLETKSSILAEQPYFGAILTAAQSFDIHPILLFAITGQEQGFVPKSNKQYKQIANNPFNVFHSWQDFNTNIQESAEIAARTVVNLSKNRPADVDPFTWINRKYAEDPMWSDGVRSIFATMKNYMEKPRESSR